MTRKEEIIQEAIDRYPRFVERRVGFADGALWADKTMIDKICDYLKGLTYQEYSGGPKVRKFEDFEIENLRKAMEE